MYCHSCVDMIRHNPSSSLRHLYRSLNFMTRRVMSDRTGLRLLTTVFSRFTATIAS
ncbi:uncharacterized protein BCR38DRAFT_445848 [Pseudomassariella vexata]|uniref:Uncharacterized protein n=1 Tax=Pseudomassariella vexata TaxID=1141098 RepID=A0A1Y2DIX9_9PEZI|nr:uncharacterized protein BCR38DRAFT_445848 [Pseudomassariella vexata]ORY59183.1 hypothetical protein BCR38DRAFT_445848 [Pseudomassariella vexata]